MLRLLAVLAMLLTWVSGAHSSPNGYAIDMGEWSAFIP